MRSYRVTLYMDMEDADCTQDAADEIEHMIRLYDSDCPRAQLYLSSVKPQELATGPDGKVLK